MKTPPRRAGLAGALTVLLFIAAGCNSGPSASILTDPSAILQAAVSSTATATSVHLDLTLDGNLSLDVMGTGVAAPMQLKGTTASADIDLANKAGRATFSAPGLLGIAGEAIVVDGTAYLKSTMTGPQYQQIPLGDMAAEIPSPDPSAMASMLAGLDEALAQPGVDPVKGADVECGTKTCYSVTIELTAEELAALQGESGGAMALPSSLPIPIPLPSDLGDATVNLTFRVEQDTNNLSGIDAQVGLGSAGQLTATITFSKWNEPVTVAAPPADQVKPA